MSISGEVISRAAAGDMEAFRDIYRRTSGFVYNVARRVTRNAEDADEVTQDVFLKVYRKLSGFNSLSRLRTWIYRITVNTAIDYKRRAKKHEEKRADYDSAVNSLSTGETARDAAETREEMRSVAALLEKLNPDQRACLVLKEVEGLKYREIADILKISVNTVRTRLKRARQKLLRFDKKGEVK